MLRFKKILFIVTLLLLPLVLSACSLPFGPSSNKKVNGAKGVFKTGNQGNSWVEQNTIIDKGNILSKYNTTKLAFDVFDSNIIYRATNAGLFISENSGDSWEQLNGSAITDFVLNPKTRGIIYVAVGNQLYKTTNNGKDWVLIYTEARPNVSIASIAISYFDTSLIYILENDGTLLSSSNWGDSWKTIYNFKIKTKQILINPLNSQHIFVAADKGLYRSVDQGKTWNEIVFDKRAEYPGIEQFNQLLFTNKENSLIYLSKYGILTTTNNGNTWESINLITSPSSVNINAFAFNPKNTDELYYIVGGVLYHTINQGYNWETKVAPIPGGARASQLLVDYNNPQILYLGITQ